MVRANECFGLYEFFSGNYEVQLSARSLGVSRMLCIPLPDMIELLQEFPKEREAYCFLKDSITFKQDLSQIGLSCFSCQQVNHYVLECPYLFYGTQQQKIIKELNKQINHTIMNFKRALKRKKFKSQLILTMVNQRALYFQQQNFQQLESSELDQYSSDTSIQMLGETSQYSSFNDIETLTLNQSRFEKDRKSILRVHSGSSKFTARNQKHKDSESQKSYIGSRHDASREEKEGTIVRNRPTSVSISKFGRMIKLSDLAVGGGGGGGHSEETSELKSAFSWNTRDRKVSLSNNYALDTMARLNSAEYFNNEDSRRIQSILKRSESGEGQLSYENILERSEHEDGDNDHNTQRRSQKRHSTHQTNRTNRTNKTSKTTITKTLQQLEMENSLTNSLKKSKTVSNEGFQTFDLQPPSSNNRFSIFDNNMNISPIQNPRKESQNSNSLYNNNNNSSSNMVVGLFNGSSQNNNNIASSSLNALNNAIIIPSQTSSAIAAAVAAASVSQPSSTGAVIPPVPSVNSNNTNINNNSNNNNNVVNGTATVVGTNASIPAATIGLHSVQSLNTNSGGNMGTQPLNQQNTGSLQNQNSTQKQNSHPIHQQHSISLHSQQRFNSREQTQLPQQQLQQSLTHQQQSHGDHRFVQQRRSNIAIEDIRSFSESTGTMKSFELYFPQNNIENIIERYNKLQRKRVSRRVRKKRTTQKRETLLKKNNNLTSNNLIVLLSKNQIDDKYNAQSSVLIEEDSNTQNKALMTSSIATMLQSNHNIQQNNTNLSSLAYKPSSKKEIFSLSAFNINEGFGLNLQKPKVQS